MTERPLDEFIRQQTRILALFNGVRPLLSGSLDHARDRLPAMRQEIVGAMQECQIYKHARLYDPHIASGSPHRRAVQELKIGCIMLGEKYIAHYRAWDTAAVAANWHGFRLSALAIMTETRKSLGEEADAVRALDLHPVEPIGRKRLAA
ncbi:hypothetical protein [Sphingomonas oligophenolica]|nr:hypothetical protein [Sphingomonas oligophenolica]